MNQLPLKPGNTKGDWTSLIIPPAMVIVIGLLFHFAGGALGAYPQRILLDSGIMIVAAVSLTIVNGFTGQFSIGHAAFMAMGGYVSGFITYYTLLRLTGTTQAEATLIAPAQWLLPASALVAGIVSAAAGWFVGLPSLRLKGDYLAIVTLGFGEILRVLLQQTDRQQFSSEELAAAGWFGVIFPPDVGGSAGFESIPKLTNLFWVYLFVAVTVLFAYRLKQSSYGRAMLSIREDEVAAEAMGINVTKLKVRAFMFAAFFAGIAGTLFAHQPGTLLRPQDAGFARSFDVVMIVVLGGLGSVSGAVLAAIVITVLNAFLVDLAQYRQILFALILILMMIFRPQGLLGLRELWDLWRFTPRPENNTDADTKKTTEIAH